MRETLAPLWADKQSCRYCPARDWGPSPTSEKGRGPSRETCGAAWGSLGRFAIKSEALRSGLRLTRCAPGGSAHPGRDWHGERGSETSAGEQEACGEPQDKENTAPPGTCGGPTERRSALPSTNAEGGDGLNENGP
ncbi:hypothetical protein NDU88_000201 [Pleurodeles waltl]|uniref:Uncharacterized protein n=1 Tax=Pleurodeles waltl TaxID=8319 RepID=A0AAV7TE76_PLEWA|nr:hypothetical protein NDU88_000201 [Pleurodeles waltl]